MCLNSQTLLFAGEGPFLRVFDHTTGKVLIETRVFTSQAIHGIVIGSASKLCGSNNVCAIFVWGGRYIRAAQVVYSREHSLDCNHIRIDFTGPQIGCSGWILDAALHIDTVTDIRPPSLILAVFVTAHNDLLVCEIRHEQEAPKNILLRKLVAGPRSILYSAHVVWLSGTQVLVAAGTVFGEVLLWSLHLRGEDLGSSRCAGHLHRIYTGHEGSIFGVQISQEIQPRGYTHPRRFLASCSDDRTIRIWEVSDLSLAVHDAGGDAANQLRESRETGFGSFDSTADISQSEGCLAFGRGHASRIWSVRFLPRTPKEGPIANLLNILSFGEDATVQRWTVNFDAEGLDVGQLSRDTEIQLNHINTSSLHSGKNIWCSTVITQSESSWILITGGADGKIASNEIPLTENSENSALAITYVFNDFENTKGDLRSQPNLSSQTPRLLHGPQYSVDGLYEYSTISPLRTSHDGADTGGVAPEVFISSRLAFRTYAFIDDRSSFLAIVESGLVVLGSLHPTSSMESSSTSGSLGPRESTQIVWRILRRNDTLKSYPILAGVPPCAMAFLGGTDGTIHCYDHISGSFQPIVTLNRKISGLFAQVIQQPLESRAKDPQSVGLVAALLGFSTAYSWQVRRECDEDGTRVVRIFQSWTLELPPGFIVTSSCFLLSSKILILGARKGTLAVYGLSSDEKTKCTLTPKACFQRVQEGDAVTVILPLPNLHFHNEVMATYILTAGRNGTYSIHGLNLQHDANVHHELRLETIHISTPPFGPNIEGAQFHPTSNELILWGFRGKNFVVWNETNQSETMTVDCGGAHREWTFFYHHDDRGSLIWTKASKLSLNWQRQPSHRVITEGSHGREIKACATSSPIDTGGHSKCRLVVTGAEDTDLRLFAYGEDAKSLVGSRFRWFGAFRKHVTGIQHLQWCGNAGFLFSGGGTEEFFVWRVRFVPGFGIGMVCEAEWPPMGELSDLRVMSFHVLEMNPEQGAIDMQNYFLISVVFSNSTVRVSLYNILYDLLF